MIHSYFVAYSYRRNGEEGWSFGNCETTTEGPMEEASVREAVSEKIAANLYALCPGYYTVVISNWILQNSHFSEEARAQYVEAVSAEGHFNGMKLTYFVAYSSNPKGSALWHFGNATLTIDQHIEVDEARESIAREIAKYLFMEFGGAHTVIITNWKLLRRQYPMDTRALPKM